MNKPEDKITITLFRDEWRAINSALLAASQGQLKRTSYDCIARVKYEEYRRLEDLLTAILFPIGK